MNCRTKLTIKQCNKMLEMQENINIHINPQWKKANNDWTLAMLVEVVEGIEHHGWKWWKHQEKDMNQLRMELVDIWHFILCYSMCYFSSDSHNEISKSIINAGNRDADYETNSCLENLKVFAAHSAMGVVNYEVFFTLCEQVGMSSNMLFESYVGKNVLNKFRQDNGYKEGTYIKIWKDGREDNEHLMDYMREVDVKDDSVDTVLYQLLAANYG